MIHPKDKSSYNPRVQCSVCAKWKRLDGKVWSEKNQQFESFSRFFGGCGFNRGNDHLAGDHSDVCDDCCNIECKRLGAEAGIEVTKEMTEHAKTRF